MPQPIRLFEASRNGARVTYRFEGDPRWFRRNEFFVEYDRESDANPGIDAMPFAALAAPIAWATGADLQIPLLDAAFAESLERSKRYFHDKFPKWSFSGRMTAALAPNSAPDATGSALLFSGGLDSVASYVHLRETLGFPPALFTILGADMPLDNEPFLRLCRERFDAFARQEEAPLSYIKTDALDVLRLGELRTFAKNWYGEVAHGLFLSAVAAPAAYRTVRDFYVASCSHSVQCRYACGSEGRVLGGLRWADTTVHTHNDGIARWEKAERFIKGRERVYPFLRVCWEQYEEYNCGRCEKCLRTICELLIGGVDPSLCRFPVSRMTFEILRDRMEHSYYEFFRGQSTVDFWRSIRARAAAAPTGNLHGEAGFFRWLAGYKCLDRDFDPGLALMHKRWNGLRRRARVAAEKASAALASPMPGLGKVRL